MIDRELVERKLRRIEELVKEISSIEINSFENFKNDIIKKRFIERNMELAVEQMVSICKHLVSALDLKEPQTYSECMDILYEAGIIGKEYLDIYKSMIRFRNLLIHGYDGIDDSITYGIYKKRLGDFYLFAREIRDYLSLLKNN